MDTAESFSNEISYSLAAARSAGKAYLMSGMKAVNDEMKKVLVDVLRSCPLAIQDIEIVDNKDTVVAYSGPGQSLLPAPAAPDRETLWKDGGRMYWYFPLAKGDQHVGSVRMCLSSDFFNMLHSHAQEIIFLADTPSSIFLISKSDALNMARKHLSQSNDFSLWRLGTSGNTGSAGTVSEQGRTCLLAYRTVTINGEGGFRNPLAQWVLFGLVPISE